MIQIPEILDLLKAGVHFGHQASKWHPKMASFIFTSRQGVHIINLEETQKKLKEALDFLREAAANGKTVLFVGTKEQAKPLLEKAAKEAGLPYITERWLGGLLTNFQELLILLKKFRRLKAQRESGELAKYTKKEQGHFAKEIAKMEKILSGIETLERRPDVIFLVDMKKEKTAFKEALLTKTKIVGICDTNVNPEKVDYPIPANDDAVKSIELIVGLAVEAVKEGRSQAPAPVVSAATPVAGGAPMVTARTINLSE